MANSTSEALGDAAKTAIDALGLTLAGKALPASVKRKTPSDPPGISPPQIVVTVGSEGPTQYLTRLKKLKKYPVAVTLVTANGSRLADDAEFRKLRQQIETALEDAGTWTGLAGWNRVKMVNGDPFNAAALPKDFNYTTITAEVEMLEPRG